jgi:hypothetical protein
MHNKFAFHFSFFYYNYDLAIVIQFNKKMCLTFYWLIDITYSELVGWYTRHLAFTKFGNQKLLVIFLIKIKIKKTKKLKEIKVLKCIHLHYIIDSHSKIIILFLLRKNQLT